MVVGTHDHASWRRLVGELPAVLGREPHPLFLVWEGRVGGEAMEDKDVTRFVVGRQPARFEVVERPVPTLCGLLATWQDGESAESLGNLSERHPAGEHVLHGAGVLVDDVAWLVRSQRGRVDDSR